MRFDQTIGRLYLNKTAVGYVSFWINGFRTQLGGHLWWRKYGPEKPAIEVLEVYGAWPKGGCWEDSLLFHDDQIAWARNLMERKTWELWPHTWANWPEAPQVDSALDEDGIPRPIVLDLVMLHGDERIAAWNEFGWASPLTR